MPQSKRRKPKYTGPTEPDKRTQSKKRTDPSPRWYVITMIALMAVGVLIVVARFALDLPQVLLLVGLAAMVSGFIMTTRYR